MSFSGGLESTPHLVTLDTEAATKRIVPIPRWIDMAARGWYSGDSHVHLHTGGPIDVTITQAPARRCPG